MARTELERTVLPSLLDRLTDEAPRTPADPPTTREDSVRRFRESVLRDVEWLLNTRRTMEPAPATLKQLRRSAYDYGIPDTLSLPISLAEGQERLVTWVEQTLAIFEPRLTDVRVALVQAEQVAAPQVRFTVSALLRMDPSPVRVAFDTVLDIAAGEYAVAEGRAA